MGAPDRDIAQAKDFIAPPGYRCHRPEATLLYRDGTTHVIFEPEDFIILYTAFDASVC